MYDCESQHISTHHLTTLCTAIANVIGSASTRRSLDITYTIASVFAQDVGPSTHSVQRRVTLWRTLATRSELQHIIKYIITQYLPIKNRDTDHTTSNLEDLRGRSLSVVAL